MTALTLTLEQFHQIREAEAYFEFFDLDYDPHIVNVNRLHILRKFSQLMAAVETPQSEAQRLRAYRQALEEAYTLFTTSNSVEQKLFKVFQDKPKNIVMLSDIEVE